mmetsp:Transcript_13185/g.34523  ORF Transcript_13185/g.34523 Transcript_13185/m.34523 type:complete len:115 (-) Transcript_13185:1690-2034(-)
MLLDCSSILRSYLSATVLQLHTPHPCYTELQQASHQNTCARQMRFRQVWVSGAECTTQAEHRAEGRRGTEQKGEARAREGRGGGEGRGVVNWWSCVEGRGERGEGTKGEVERGE